MDYKKLSRITDSPKLTDEEKVIRMLESSVNEYGDAPSCTLSTGEVVFGFAGPYGVTAWVEDEDDDAWYKRYVEDVEDAWENVDKNLIAESIVENARNKQYIYEKKQKWNEEIDAENQRESW